MASEALCRSDGHISSAHHLINRTRALFEWEKSSLCPATDAGTTSLIPWHWAATDETFGVVKAQIPV